MKKFIFTPLISLFTIPVIAADGDLDLSFNGTGLVTVGYGISGLGTSSAIQPDGKILVGYTIVKADNNADAVVYRYNANGSLDATFGTNGLVIFDLNGGIEGDPKLLLAADGKIVVVFKAQRASPAEIRIALARLNTNGSLDTTFSTNGITTSNFDSGGQINSRFSEKLIRRFSETAFGTSKNRQTVSRIILIGGRTPINSRRQITTVTAKPTWRFLETACITFLTVRLRLQVIFTSGQPETLQLVRRLFVSKVIKKDLLLLLFFGSKSFF